LAAFGVVVAIAVYMTMGERQNAPTVNRTPSLDPSAVLESVGATFQQFREARQDYVIEADRQLTYEGGASKFVGVTITVRQRAGRNFRLSGREAQAGQGQTDIDLLGDVTLAASDGFLATADHAVFSEADATVRVSGPVSFQRGQMTGSSVGMTYDQETDTLSLLAQAHVTVTDASGVAATEFHANTATLDRLQSSLTLIGDVHVLRGQQVLEAAESDVHLSTGMDFVTAIELRRNATVVGGSAFDSMAAQDIDLNYTEDGATLEHVLLSGDGAIVMKAPSGETGRKFVGDLLDLSFAPDASLTRAVGNGHVNVALPSSPELAARSIGAAAFEATGEPGKDLTSARFNGNVEYREEASEGRVPRVIRSDNLSLVFAGASVTAAVFENGVQFTEQGLQASGARAEYDPTNATLRLSGADGLAAPRVSDAQIEVEADVIDVTLDKGQITAVGSVTTLLYASASGRLPGLLEEGEPVNVSANTLEYQRGTGLALYAGNATLWQGATALRGDEIVLDRASANLIASGTARSTIALDLGEAVGRATEIRYYEDRRTIVYETPAPTPDSINVSLPSRLSGPQGDIGAWRIEVVLGRMTSSTEKLEANGNVSAHLGARVVTGDSLAYFAADERYVINGIPTVPVTIAEDCRETSGRTITFFKSSERIVVDGREEVRTQSKRGTSCVAEPTLQ